MGHLGTCPPRLTTIFSVLNLTYTKSDSDYMSKVASGKQPVTFVPLLATNPGDATDCSGRHNVVLCEANW